MRKLRFGICVTLSSLLLALLVVSCTHADLKHANLATLSEWKEMYELCLSDDGSPQFPGLKQRRQELSMIHRELTKTPARLRAKRLIEIRRKTKWGTPERTTAYFVSAKISGCSTTYSCNIPESILLSC